MVVRESWSSGLTVFVSLISLWLKRNAAEALRKQIGSLPRVEELNRLKKELCYNFNLSDIRYTLMKNLTKGNSATKHNSFYSDFFGGVKLILCLHLVLFFFIRWQRGWGLAHRCSQLQSLTRLAEQNPEALNNLQGNKKKTLICTLFAQKICKENLLCKREL